MAYKVWCGLPTATLEGVKHAIPRVRSTLDDALLDAMLIEDAGVMIVFEIEGDDGTHLSRQEVKATILRRRDELTTHGRNKN